MIIIECVFFYIGFSYKIGEVYDGVVIMDWMEQEQECGIIIIFVVMKIFWKWKEQDYVVNIIDILGYVDFIVEVECFFCVLDGVVVLFCVVFGVEFQFEIVWCQVNCYKVLCIGFVNKMDCFGVDFFNVVNDVKEKLGVNVVFLQVLIGVEEIFEGVVDLIINEVCIWNEDDMGMIYQVVFILEELKDIVSEYCSNLFEVVVEYDEEFLEKFFEDESSIFVDEICVVICVVVIDMSIIFMMCGFVFKNKGVQAVLDVVCVFMLFLVDVEVIIGINLDIEVEEFCKLDVNELFLVLVFKIVMDLFVG